MNVQLFYCLPSGQFFGSWVGDPGKDDNRLAAQGYIEVPHPADSTQHFWDADKQTFYLPVSPDAERAWRDNELESMIWLRERHRDQLEIGGSTTLSPEQFNELLVHMQALRDWPQSEAFPDAGKRPQAPKFIEQFGGDQ